MKAKAVLGALILCAIATDGQAEMNQCHQADGTIQFRQEPCPLAEMAPQEPQPRAAAPRPAPARAPVAAPATTTPAADAGMKPKAGERVVTVPPAAAVVPAPGPQDDGFVKPTKRKRDVLELAAQFERCRADAPGFAEKSAPIYAAWTRRHAAVLSEYDRLLTAKVRASRRGEASLPMRLCTEEWLRGIEPLTRVPDPRFSTVEKTWQLFMGALMTGDREAALNCLGGRAEARWKERVEAMSDDDLRRIGASIRALQVRWGDDYEKEGVVADTTNRLLGIAFRNVNEEWKITEMGPSPTPALPAQ